MTNQTNADIETKIDDDLMFHRFLAVLMDLSKMDRSEIADLEPRLKRYIEKQDPCFLCFSQKATEDLLECLRKSAKY